VHRRLARVLDETANEIKLQQAVWIKLLRRCEEEWRRDAALLSLVPSVDTGVSAAPLVLRATGVSVLLPVQHIEVMTAVVIDGFKQ
jgi:hypothetical protein